MDNNNGKDDIEILKRSFDDPEAFAVIYRKYYKAIFKHIYDIIGDAEITKDLTEETFLRVIEKRELIVKKGRNFGNYLTGIATNIAIQYYRDKQREEGIISRGIERRKTNDAAGEGVYDSGDAPVSTNNFTEENATTLTEVPHSAEFSSVDYEDEEKDYLLKAIDELPYDEHACIVMYYMENKTMKEIAFLMNTSKSTVFRKLNDAKKKIKEKLKIYSNMREKNEK